MTINPPNRWAKCSTIVALGRPWLRLGAILACILLPGLAQAVEVTGIRFGIHGKQTRVVVDISHGVSFVARTLDEPARLVVDLPDVDWNVQRTEQSSPHGLASALRYGRLDPEHARIVVDLRQPVEIEATQTIAPSAAIPYYRIVIDLRPRPAGAPRPPAEAPVAQAPAAAAPAASTPVGEPATPPRPSAIPELARAPEPVKAPAATASAPPAPADQAAAPVPQARPATVPIPPDPASLPLIAIDAGHGGIDPGTIAVSGALEKHVTLAMARTLAEQLRATGHYRTLLVRDDDSFIRLRQRIAIAHEAKADLLISLHADSIKEANLRGASVYTLSETASDQEAERLAAKENKADIIGGTDLSHHDEIVASILIDLAQRDTNNKSIDLADLLIGELGSVTKLVRNTRRYAGFAVLKSPDTPSVLVELGYLSNPADAENLVKPSHREKLAHAIRTAIDSYFEKLRPPL